MRRVRPTLTLLLSTLFLYVQSTSLDAAERVVTVSSTDGLPIRVLVTVPTGEIKGNLMLLVGGDGRLQLTKTGKMKRGAKNFLVRSRQIFNQAGFLTALVDAPQNRQEAPGLLGGFRASQAHATDLAAVATAIAKLNEAPIFVFGISRGSVSAANLAARDSTDKIGAIVLASSVSKANTRGTSLQDIALSEIRSPVLFVHNRRDGCRISLLSNLLGEFELMNLGGGTSDLFVIDGGQQEDDNPCRQQTFHGFFGVESRVIDMIIAWLMARH